jgi:erythromycin esterase
MKELSYDIKSKTDLSLLINKIGDASVIMMGEASHGTHEYYTWRSAISKELIINKKISFIAVEGDWPDCYKINRYIKGYPDSGKNIYEVLNSFDRWPTWMWANWEVAAMAEWMKEYNSGLPMDERIGFYGLDVYSLWESLDALMDYLEKEDPEAAKNVKKVLLCFEPYREEGMVYARATSILSQTCMEQAINMLTEIRMKAPFYDGDREAALNAKQNAYTVVDAEKYYRSMLGFDNESWNIRDRHMMETFQRLMNFHGNKSKGIVWEHNTHIGDARATDMKGVGMINTGQLARERYGKETVFLIGFGSYQGTVIAATAWEAPIREMNVPPAIKGSIEDFLHSENQNNQLILFDRKEAHDKFYSPYPHRAIGVVYHPENEKYTNYVPTILSARYDAFIYLDTTRALHPLHLHPNGHKIPETYPFGI